MLPDWRLAVVLSETDSRGAAGLAGAAEAGRTQPPEQRTGVMPLSDLPGRGR